MSTLKPAADMVSIIAAAIALCDFRVTVSRYVTADAPWIITVGEQAWQRHIVVESVAPDLSIINLAILSPGQSGKFGYDINFTAVDRRITLKELVSRSHSSVKDALWPGQVAA